ncbi:hypothetical protein NQ317_014912 [Molorchus minor]|uniref:3-hydroxyisobutyrate dehydrogenase n=1 Tax=Molorchus minor TaxID=1323400 RepID=A0ABQ9IZI9_9CUCU|nr:hypothetical protein NQ317_014912 [Molorchus minor]
MRRNESHIAFVGLGNMGARMAKNLIKHGKKVNVYDINPSAVTALEQAKPCNSPAEAASGASLVFTMLPNGEIVKEAILGDNGIFKEISKNALLVDCSTVEPRVAQELHSISKKNYIRFLDAPVSGGIVGAEAATLTFMVGGDKDSVNEITPVLLHMGSTVHYCGNVGNGQIAKICNNLVLVEIVTSTTGIYSTSISHCLEVGEMLLTDELSSFEVEGCGEKLRKVVMLLQGVAVCFKRF